MLGFGFRSNMAEQFGGTLGRVRGSMIFASILIALTISQGDGRAQPAQAVFSTSRGDTAIELEIADTDRARARGLMFRKTLAKNRGMIFVFPLEVNHPFWMKDTLIPLDMIFLDRERRVVGIVRDTEPLTLTSRSCGRRSLYVIEVNAGLSKTIQLEVGDAVELEGVPPQGKN